jgi:hypothetical protein
MACPDLYRGSFYLYLYYHPYWVSVDLNWTGLSAVQNRTSNSTGHVILQRFVFVLRKLLISTGFFRTLKMGIFGKINLDLKRLSVIKHVLINRRLTCAFQQGCFISRILIPPYELTAAN